jgi:hypothetical protein
MKFWKLTSAVSGLVLSASANAAILSYGGYTHDTTTNIVTGNGLEWLQWDATLGWSINSIQSQLGTLEGGGWSVASNAQMTQLFNAFDFGITFDTDESTSQSVSTGYNHLAGSIADPDLAFISMFSETYQTGGYWYCHAGHCLKQSIAIYGQDLNNNGLYNLATVRDDYQDASTGRHIDGLARLSADYLNERDGDWSYGIALVREVSPVPVPAVLWLFGSGLLGLIAIARRKKLV